MVGWWAACWWVRVLSLEQLSGAAAAAAEGGGEEAEAQEEEEEEGRSRGEEGEAHALPPTPARPTEAAASASTCAPVRHRAVHRLTWNRVLHEPLSDRSIADASTDVRPGLGGWRAEGREAGGGGGGERLVPKCQIRSDLSCGCAATVFSPPAAPRVVAL